MLVTIFIIIGFFLIAGEAIAIGSCAPGNYLCNDGTCISKSLFCDNNKDCTTGEDEFGCRGDESGCDYLTQFECWDGRCIYIHWVCDGYADCSQGEDELDCSTSTSEIPTTSTYSTTFTTGPYSNTPYPTTSYLTTSTQTPYFSTQYPTTVSTTSIATTYTPEYTTSHPATTTFYPPRICDYPYERLGNRCVFVDPVLPATWDEARYICGRAGGGDLVILDSLDFFSDLIQYIQTKGLNHHSYWIGGRGNRLEERWEWANGEDIRMGTPLWALNYSSYSNYEQEPINFYKSMENCGYLDVKRYYYMDDDDCNEIKAAICQMPTWTTSLTDSPTIMQGKPVFVSANHDQSPEGELFHSPVVLKKSSHDKTIQDPVDLEFEEKPIQKSDVSKDASQTKEINLNKSLEAAQSKPKINTAFGVTDKFLPDKANLAINNNSNSLLCDYPYEVVGDRCVVVDPVLKATWDEARYLCGRSMGGDLVILDSIDFYGQLIDYMKNNGLNLHDYWVGGMGVVSELRWKWVSGSTVPKGTPLWALNGTAYDYYEQEPTDYQESLSNCGYLDRERYHFMADTDCQEVKAVVCQIPTWTENEGIEIEKPKEQDFNPERLKELKEITQYKTNLNNNF